MKIERRQFADDDTAWRSDNTHIPERNDDIARSENPNDRRGRNAKTKVRFWRVEIKILPLFGFSRSVSAAYSDMKF